MSAVLLKTKAVTAAAVDAWLRKNAEAVALRLRGNVDADLTGETSELMRTALGMQEVVQDVKWNGHYYRDKRDRAAVEKAGIEIFVGPRGGRYYYDDSGHKIYLTRVAAAPSAAPPTSATASPTPQDPVLTGPRGGKYRIDHSGRRVYVQRK